jgi:uncharacterized peroxidase-related enzyme
MAFIHTIPEEHASPQVARMYMKSRDALGYLPNYTRLFSHRPQVMEAWENFLGSIRSNMDQRRYELVTLAAARALKSSYCMLAHGTVLNKKFFSPEELTTIAQDYQKADLTPAEVTMMTYVEKVVRDANAITQADVDGLKVNGFSDPEIFDITTAAAARCFFSKTLDALGAQPDSKYLEMEGPLRQVLTVGRPIDGQTQEL